MAKATHKPPVTPPGGDDTPKPTPKAMAKEATGFEEWKCEVKTQTVDGKTEQTYEKLKKKRENVKISEEEAEALNQGRLQGGNKYTTLYLRPE